MLTLRIRTAGRLDVAVGTGKEVAQLLLEKALGQCERYKGRSVTFASNHEVVELLLKKGADVNAKDERGRTAVSLLRERPA